ncbi:hypothetical protein HMPREF1990_01038, partial [Porphyromonas gingivalis W4087]
IKNIAKNNLAITQLFTNQSESIASRFDYIIGQVIQKPIVKKQT